MIDERCVRLPDVQLDRSYPFCKAARLAGKSPRTLVRYRIEGVKLSTGNTIKLRAFRSGRNWCVTGAELLEFLRQMQTPAVQLGAPRNASAGEGRDYAAVADRLGL